MTEIEEALRLLSMAMDFARSLFVWIFVLDFAGNQASGETTPRSLRVLQFNVWQGGSHVPEGMGKIADVIVESGADVVAFSEVRHGPGEDWHGKLLEILRAKSSDRNFQGKYVGGDVGVISRFPIVSTALIFDETATDSGSIMAYRLQLPGAGEMTVCTAHLDFKHYALNWVRGYHGGDPDWKERANAAGELARVTDAQSVLAYNKQSRRGAAIAAFLSFAQQEHVAGRAIILAGDFNEGSHLDWTERARDFAGHYGAVLPWENSLALRAAGFHDAWRAIFPDELRHPGFTWPATVAGQKTTSWAPKSDERDRIDFIYHSAGVHAIQGWVVGPRTCFIGEERVQDPGEDLYLCDQLPWPSDHKGMLVQFGY